MVAATKAEPDAIDEELKELFANVKKMDTPEKVKALKAMRDALTA